MKKTWISTEPKWGFKIYCFLRTIICLRSLFCNHCYCSYFAHFYEYYSVQPVLSVHPPHAHVHLEASCWWIILQKAILFQWDLSDSLMKAWHVFKVLYDHALAKKAFKCNLKNAFELVLQFLEDRSHEIFMKMSHTSRFNILLMDMNHLWATFCKKVIYIKTLIEFYSQ